MTEKPCDPSHAAGHHCRRCGRELTNERSVAAGIGRTCARKEALEEEQKKETEEAEHD